MKDTLAITLLGLLTLSLAAGYRASNTSRVEDEIKRREQNWAQLYHDNRVRVERLTDYSNIVESRSEMESVK